MKTGNNPSFRGISLFFFIALESIVALPTYAQEPLLETIVQTGHYEAVNTVRYSPDGSFLVTGSDDETVKLWEVSTGREIRTFTGSNRPIMTANISQDNKYLVSVCNDSSAWLWEVATGKAIKKFKTNDDFINNAIFTPDGAQVITGGSVHNAALWDIETGQMIRRFTTEKSGCYAGRCMVSLELSKDGKRLLTGIADRSAIVWDFATGEIIHRVKGHRGSCSSCISAASIHPSGKTFVTVSRSDSIRYWNSKSGKQENKYFSKDGFEQVAISADGRYLGALQRGIFTLFNYTGAKETKTFGKNGDVGSFGFSPDGKYVALGGKDKTITILTSGTFKPVRTIAGYVNQMEDKLNANIRTWIKNKNTQVLSPDGKYMARGKIGNLARIWDVANGRTLHDLEGHDNTVTDMAFSPDGKRIVTASADKSARVWDVETGALLNTLTYHTAAILSVAYSHDGTKIVTGGWDGLVVAWDAESGRPVSSAKPHGDYAPVEVAFAPGDLYIITGGLDKKLVMTEFDTGQPVREFIGHTNHVVSIAFSKDGKHMLTGSWDGLAKMWDLSTGFQIKRFAGHEGSVYDVAFGPDGKTIATASQDKTVRIWDIEKGTVLSTMTGHTGSVTSVNFTPTPGQLYSAGRDGSTKLWETATGKEIFTHIFTGMEDWLVKVPDGRFYATDGARKSVFFVKGTESFNIERFYDNFYTPGLLESLVREAVRDAPKLNLLEHLEEFPSPGIEIMSPKPPYPDEMKKVEIMMRVTNNGGGIEEIKVLHNGKRIIKDTENLHRVDKKGKSIVKMYEVNLMPGNNLLEITAFSKGRIESRKQTLTLYADGEAPKGDCYIFCIGINKYKNPRLNLNYAEADAKSFVGEMKKSGKDLFGKIEVVDLYNEKASRENILSALEELKGKVTSNDVFYFYYAGHGSIVDGEFYFVPHDNVRLYEKEALQKEAVSAAVMQENFREISALKQVLFIDACHSGGSTELLAERGAAEEKALAQLSRSAGIHVLAAAGSEQTAAEFKELGHGLFTYMLLEALKGRADGAPLDEKVTVYELKSFLDDQVPEYSRKYKGSPQYPSTFSRGHDFPVSVRGKQ